MSYLLIVLGYAAAVAVPVWIIVMVIIYYFNKDR